MITRTEWNRSRLNIYESWVYKLKIFHKLTRNPDQVRNVLQIGILKHMLSTEKFVGSNNSLTRWVCNFIMLQMFIISNLLKLYFSLTQSKCSVTTSNPIYIIFFSLHKTIKVCEILSKVIEWNRWLALLCLQCLYTECSGNLFNFCIYWIRMGTISISRCYKNRNKFVYKFLFWSWCFLWDDFD